MALPPAHLLGELATALVAVVAAKAGAIVSIGRDYGIDGTARKILGRLPNGAFVPSAYPFDFQLKTTRLGDTGASDIVYDLDVRAFNLIVGRPADAPPMYLFLCCFERDESDWLIETEGGVEIHGKLFWWRETGDLSSNTKSRRIVIARSNRLTVDAFVGMLERSEAGQP